MKRINVVLAALALLPASQAMSQSNPFRPPAAGGGMSKAQIQEMVAQELARQQGGGRSPQGGPSGGGLNSQLRDPGVNGLPSQRGGRPVANTAGGGGRAGMGSGGGASAPDPVADVLSDGGQFVGCVSSTPVFKDKVGRRVYFTSKELRESNAARRYAHCG